MPAKPVVTHPAAETDRAIQRLASRIAAQFAREREHEVIDTIARAAVEAATLAVAIKAKGPSQGRLSRLEEVVAPYGARVIDNRDPAGMTVGLRFTGARYSSGIRDIMFLA